MYDPISQTNYYAMKALFDPLVLRKVTLASAAELIASGKAIMALPKQATAGMPPAREPSDAFRRALAQDRIQTNRIWLDTRKTSDGRYWSAVHPREFSGMKRDGHIATVIEKVYGPFNVKQMNTPLADLITPAMEKKIVRMLEQQHAA